MNASKRVLALTALLLSTTLMASAESMKCTVPEGQYVNVRKQASSKAASWGKLHRDDVVEVDSVDKGWIKFEYNGHIAYVKSKYFEEVDGATYVVVSNGRVRLRESPNGNRVGWVNSGEEYTVLSWSYGSDNKLWGKLQGTGGGYVSIDYLQKVN